MANNPNTPASGVKTKLDENTVVKSEFFTTPNADAIIDGLNAHASQGKQFASRLIPGGGGGSGLTTVNFVPSNKLNFPAAGRSYLVTLNWGALAGSFSPFPLAASVVPQDNASPLGSEWCREDARTGPRRMSWIVYLPSLAHGTVVEGYTGVNLSASVTAVGIWSNANNLQPACTWQISDPIP